MAHRGLPFDLQIPNENTIKAIERSRAGKGETL
ncbi:MAG: type II toxin-antitoxin system RelB/DinJ family antitoxin [Deltaproteobacteria bacterium]|nr:type II toxin-antitoxin system RelB/DinJ family antitoxin [Deltaproteobacteria bacterium]